MFRDKSLSEEYIDLILELDEVTKACEYNDRLYGKMISDIMLYQGQLQREFIRKSAMHNLCSIAVKANEPLNIKWMNKLINRVIDSYDEFLGFLKAELDELEGFVPAAPEDIAKSFEIYSRIGKLLHPKINNLSLTDADLAFIWAKTTDSYARNDWKDLMFLEERAIRTMREQGVDASRLSIVVDERMVEHLRQTVNDLKESEDYVMGFNLMSDEWILNERERLLAESAKFEQLIAALDESIHQMITSGVKMVLD